MEPANELLQMMAMVRPSVSLTVWPAAELVVAAKGSIELKETEVIDVSRYPDLGERIRPFQSVVLETTNDNGHRHGAIVARLHAKGPNCRSVREQTKAVNIQSWGVP
jgi:hypothetical protein